MDVDVKPEADETDPGDTTEATASTADDDEDGEQARSARASKSVEPVPERRSLRHKTPPKEAAEKPPPPRSLPFGGKRPTKPAPAATPAEGETDSDDEL